MLSRRVRRILPALLLVLVSSIGVVLVSVSFALNSRAALADGAHVDVMQFTTEVSPASLRFLTRAIATAESDGARALVIEIDSPGGDLDSMKSMTEAELNSSVPIISYVSPSGGFAASAGAFVALAAPIAVMAPATRIGASSPILSTGADIGSTLKAKLEHDLVASMTSMQQRFGRNVNLATQMVTGAASYDNVTAVNQGIVNFEATNLSELLSEVDGRQAILSSGVVTVQTTGVSVQTIAPSLFDNVYTFLLDPNVVFLLFIVAMIGIYLEISHPGAILPGTVGGIALLLFLFAIGSLSPNWAGLALMLLAFVLLVFDLRLPTHGILTVGAIISLIFGALLFFNSGGPYGGPQVNPVVVYVMAGVIGLMSFTLITVIVRTQHKPVTTGVEGMIGATVTALTPLLPEGRVNYGGENWAAVLDNPATSVDAGSEVRVVGIEGLRLYVEPIRHPSPIDIQTPLSLE